MSPSDVQDDSVLNTANPDSTTSYPVTTHDWAHRPARRSSPPLPSLFPEYYEPIELEQSSPPSQPSGTANMMSNCEPSQPASDGILPKYLHDTGNELRQSRGRPVFLSGGFDRYSNAVPSAEQPAAAPVSLSVKPGAARTSDASKHHCLISGHVFEHYRLSRLPPGVQINGLDTPNQHSTHNQDDLKVCCMVCRARIREHLWKCVIPVCLREVCGDCRSRLEQERASSAKAGWRGAS